MSIFIGWWKFVEIDTRAGMWVNLNWHFNTIHVSWLANWLMYAAAFNAHTFPLHTQSWWMPFGFVKVPDHNAVYLSRSAAIWIKLTVVSQMHSSVVGRQRRIERGCRVLHTAYTAVLHQTLRDVKKIREHNESKLQI